MSERLRVLLLPSLPYTRLERLAAAGEHPRVIMPELLREQGIALDMIDPDEGWKNPLGRKHPFLRAMDPPRTLRVLTMRRDYDLVVSGNDGAAVALVAARRLFRFRSPIILWDLSPAMKWKLRIVLQDRTIPRLDGVIAVNAVQEPYVAARWGTHVPVVTVPYWVDTDFYRPAAAAGPGPIFLVGDDDGRDYPTFLRAIEGLEAPVAIRTGLNLDLTDRHASVTILRNRVTPVEFRDLYADCRFVVVPLQPDTRNASGNSALMEAAAMGKAVVVSDSDGIRGFVRHEETGLIVPANDPVALRSAIDRLVREPETAARLGLAARRLAEETASAPVFAARLAAAFRRLADVTSR